MKNTLVLALLLASTVAWSYEIKENPDRVISVGVNYTGTFLDGTGTFEPVPGWFFNEQKDLKDNTHAGVVDLRIPVTPNLTLNTAAGYVSRSVERIDASLCCGDTAAIGARLTDEFSGPTINVGARYYFQ